ncbi:MAG: SUMF1/EgtB/PvdO family nonheme iron enzyme [Anaerolineales bacterium]|nr:SUMF1/EgtB/PvdO family nonheme iron enzyme [Anaerolineales bacterium]
MSQDLQACVIKILNRDGAIAGTGFTIVPNLAVTCAHVVQLAGSDRGKTVEIEFCKGGSKQFVQVLANGWSDSRVDDVAYLQLESLPEGVVSAGLGKTEDIVDDRYYTYGFPPSASYEGEPVTGTIRGTFPATGRRDLLKIEGNAIEKGFSGAPVYDLDTKSVVGMITEYKDKTWERAASATTADTLRNLCPYPIEMARCRDERSYLLWLTERQDYRVWATKFIPLAALVDLKSVIDGLEMSMAFRELQFGPEGLVRTERLTDITEALNKHQAFIILGEPGCGKTTTIQKVAFERASSLLAGISGRVPLFVRLSQQGQRTPFEFLKTEWENKISSDFTDILASGRVLILVDGVNEIVRDERNQRLKDWRLFADEATSQQNQIIFTGREKDYDQQLDLPRVLVEPMDDERISEFLRRYDASGLEEHLNDPKAQLRQMARNPFNLFLLIYDYKSDQKAMANRGKLLQEFISGLYKREEKLAHPGWLNREVQIEVLSQMAYIMQEKGESTTIALKDAIKTLPEIVDFEGEEIPVKSVDLFRFGRYATILDPTIDTDIRLYHQLFQEYFASLELLHRFEAGEDLSRLWKAPRLVAEMPTSDVGEWDPLPEPPTSGWEVTTILVCGLSKDPARLIDAVRQVNPNLAGRCLDEAGISKPEALTRAVRADLLADLYNPQVHLRARLQAGFTLGKIDDPRFKPKIKNGVKIILPQMEPVSAGKYIIGSKKGESYSFDDEYDQHKVELPAFTIGRWPVTNAEYACFMDAGGYQDEAYWETGLAKRWLQGEDVAGGQSTYYMQLWKIVHEVPDWKAQLEQAREVPPQGMETIETIASLGEEELKALLARGFSGKSRQQPAYWQDADRNNPSQPLVGITWFEACAYCVWLSAVSGENYRLPTEAEWEVAARGPKRLCYPWGHDWESAKANTLEGRVLKPSPVGAFAAAGESRFKAEDQAGNVWEWTSSLYLPYPYRRENSEKPEVEGERIVRGGSWGSSGRGARCASRYGGVPDYFTDSIGFRVLSPGPAHP